MMLRSSLPREYNGSYHVVRSRKCDSRHKDERTRSIASVEVARVTGCTQKSFDHKHLAHKFRNS